MPGGGDVGAYETAGGEEVIEKTEKKPKIIITDINRFPATKTATDAILMFYVCCGLAGEKPIVEEEVYT